MSTPDLAMFALWAATFSGAWLGTIGVPFTRIDLMKSGTRRAAIVSLLFTISLVDSAITNIVWGKGWVGDLLAALLIVESIWYSGITLSHHIGFSPLPWGKIHRIAFIWLFGGHLGRQELRHMAKAQKALRAAS